MAVEVATELFELAQFDLDSLEREVVIAALFLHDTFKFGEVNCGHTSSAHAELAANEYYWFCHGDTVFVTTYAACMIRDAIYSHMGQWGTTQPQTTIEQVVHLADYIASRKFFDLPNKWKLEKEEI